MVLVATGMLAAAAIGSLSLGYLKASAVVQPMDPSSFRLPAADLGALGDVSIGTPPAAALPPQTALAAAAAEYDPKALGANETRAFLETISVRGTFGGDVPIVMRAVWIVRMTGMAIEQGGPVKEDGTPAEGHTLHTAYVFIDALTGQFLMTVWSE